MDTQEILTGGEFRAKVNSCGYEITQHYNLNKLEEGKTNVEKSVAELKRLFNFVLMHYEQAAGKVEIYGFTMDCLKICVWSPVHKIHNDAQRTYFICSPSNIKKAVKRYRFLKKRYGFASALFLLNSEVKDSTP